MFGVAVSAVVSRSAGQPGHPPSPAYLLATVLGLIVAMAVTGLTLPLITTLTRAQTVRFG